MIFIILTLASCLSIKYLKINKNMYDYLPRDSKTKIGLDIMNDNFLNENSSLSVMVKDYSDSKKEKVLKYFESLDHVTDVSTKENDNYLLYTLSVDKSSDSKEAKKIYNDVTKYLDKDLIDSDGDIANEYKEVLPFYVIVIAVLSALVILIIMSESYIEPFLFLFAILISVFLNNGTNIIFGSVSNITSSIAAILQMALSMDYSIMLMNRYRQERENEEDKIEAMKKALYHSFKSISSSSITTIVGLLALVFMSFTIGKDLGFVLAKGVLCSLLSIFTVLPCLILTFDKLIYRFKKKSPIITLNFLGKLSYKFRYGIGILFLVILVGSFFLKGNLGILYTSAGTSSIEEKFTLDNEMVIVYKNDLENEVTKLCQSLKEEKHVKDTLCYSNTINEKIKVEDLNTKLNDLGSDIEVDESLAKISYYHYFNSEENNKISLDNLIKFIKNSVYKDKKMNKNISKSMKSDIDKLSNFTNKTNITKIRTKEELASSLSLDIETVKDLLILYNKDAVTDKMSLDNFLNLMTRLLKDSHYKDYFNDEIKDNIELLNKFNDKELMNKRVYVENASEIIGIEEDTLEKIYLYNLNEEISNYKMSLNGFANFILNTPSISNSLKEEDKLNLEKIKTFSNLNIINQKMKKEEIGALFGLNELIVSMIPDDITPYEFIKYVLDNKLLETEEIKTVYFIMDSSLKNKTFSYEEMSSSLAMNKNDVKNIYILFYKDSYKLSPKEILELIVNTEDINKNMESNTLKELKLLLKIINSDKNITYTAKEMASFLEMEEDSLKLVYSIADLEKDKIKVSYQDFISFLIDTSKKQEYQSMFDKNSLNRLKTVNTIMKDSLNKKKYTKNEVYNLLKKLSNKLDKDLIDLVYIYYGSEKEYKESYAITLEEYINYLNKVILNDKRFDDYIDDDLRENIKDGVETISDSKEQLVSKEYNRVLIVTNLKPEGKTTYNFIDNINKELKNKEGYYIVGDSSMAYEMNKTFASELNLITVLTMLFILAVVMFTFKSVKISVVLVLLIQSAIFLIMGILAFGGSVYFISILIVQSILMGATIDYAILYTSYYLESRKENDIQNSLILAYNNSIHTILTSASILIIVTLIVGNFASEVASKICKTLSEGTICSSILIVFLLPGLLALLDKYIIKKDKKNNIKNKDKKKKKK